MHPSENITDTTVLEQAVNLLLYYMQIPTVKNMVQTAQKIFINYRSSTGSQKAYSKNFEVDGELVILKL